MCSAVFCVPKKIFSVISASTVAVVTMAYKCLKISNIFKAFVSIYESSLFWCTTMKAVLTSEKHNLRVEDSVKNRGFEDDTTNGLGPVSVYDEGAFGILFLPIRVILKQIDIVLEQAEHYIDDQHTFKVYISSARRHLRRICRSGKSSYERVILQAKRRLPRKWFSLFGVPPSPVLQISPRTENLKCMEFTRCKKEASKRNHIEISDYDDDSDSDYIPENDFEEQISVVKSEEEPGGDLSQQKINSSFDFEVKVNPNKHTEINNYHENEINCNNDFCRDDDNDCHKDDSMKHSSDVRSIAESEL